MALAPSLALLSVTVQLDHGAVQGLLVARILAQQQVTDRAVDVAHGLQDALPR